MRRPAVRAALLLALLTACGDDVVRLDEQDATAWAKRLAGEDTRAAAEARLKEAGADAIPLLTDLLAHDGVARLVALEYLATLGTASEPAVPKLAALLAKKDIPTRVLAALAIGRIGKRTPGTVLGLEDLLADRDPMVRVAGAMAYWSVTGDSEQAHDILLNALLSSSPRVRTMAAEAYQILGAESVDPLTLALTDGHPAVRIAAAQALGELGKVAANALPALEAMDKDPNVDAREAAAAAVAKIR